MATGKNPIGFPPTLNTLVPAGSKVLWVASTGGHFAQLRRIAQMTSASEESLWVTFESNQTVSQLEKARHVFVPYIRPRDFVGTTKAARAIAQILSSEHFDHCVSTGAAIAAAALPQAAWRRVPTTYVESISRTDGPSLTGKLMRATPGVQTLTQYKHWDRRGWTYVGSVFDAWNGSRALRKPSSKRVFVTLGTIEPYRFDRAIDAILKLLRPDQEVVWQLGASMRSDLPGEVRQSVPADEFERLVLRSDIVITHAGVGSIMQILDLGKIPVLVVRQSRYKEHVDDHQRFITREMIKRDLALVLDPAAPRQTVLEEAAEACVEQAHPTAEQQTQQLPAFDGYKHSIGGIEE